MRNVLEVIETAAGNWYAQLVQLESNGARHVLSPSMPISGAKEAAELARANDAELRLPGKGQASMS